jgi:hypothetical protein
METFTKDRATTNRGMPDRAMNDRSIHGASCASYPSRRCGARLKTLLLPVLLGAVILAACGGSSSGGGKIQLLLSGNWQFTMAPPSDGSFLGGLQGGFLLQDGTSATGAATYAVSLPGLLIPCNIGTATITGSITGSIGNQNEWTITAVAGTQTFTLQGIQSFDGTTIAGTYNSTAGTAADGGPCGTAQTGLQWSATLVPPITGNLQGSFHSTGGAAGLTNQDFLLSGSITQAQNTGASSAAVSGTMNFSLPGSNNSDYPCFDTASVYGQISGNSVTLQIVGPDESILGQIGEPANSNGVTGLNPVTFDSTQGGYILHAVGPSYLVATNTCPGNLSSTSTAGDYGDICLAVGSPSGTNACQEPINLAPAAVTMTYPPVPPATTSTETVTLGNTSNGALSGLTLAFANNPPTATNFSETDNCGPGGIPSQGQPFNLASGGSCVITITFTPQCGSQCSSPLSATLTVTSPASADDNTVFTVPITGTVTGEGAVQNFSSTSQDLEQHHAETN